MKLGMIVQAWAQALYQWVSASSWSANKGVARRWAAKSWAAGSFFSILVLVGSSLAAAEPAQDTKAHKALLHAAIVACHSQVVQIVLAANPALVNTELDDKHTPLSLSLECESEATLLSVLQTPGVEVDLTPPLYRRGETSLMMAVDSLAKTQLLLQHGARVQARTRYNYTALNFAVEKGNLATIKALVQAGADVNDPKAPPLASVAWRQASTDTYDSVVALLLQLGADIQTQGPTALEKSISELNREAIRALLQHKAPLPAAAFALLGHHFVEYAKHMIRPRDKFNRFIQKGIDLAQILIDHGADINAVSDIAFRRYSILQTLMWSELCQGKYEVPLIDEGLKDFIQFLIQNGANPDIAGDRNIIFSPVSTRMSLIRFVLSYMSPEAVNASEKNGWTALMWFIQRTPDFTYDTEEEIAEYLQTVEAFLKAGYRVDLKYTASDGTSGTAFDVLRNQRSHRSHRARGIIKAVKKLFKKYRNNN